MNQFAIPYGDRFHRRRKMHQRVDAAVPAGAQTRPQGVGKPHRWRLRVVSLLTSRSPVVEQSDCAAFSIAVERSSPVHTQTPGATDPRLTSTAL
jgi:hypothetical protein